MSVQYYLDQVPNQPGKFYPRVVIRGSVRTEDLSQQIAAKTLVQPADVNAVFDTMDDEIVINLKAGNSVNLDDFVGFIVSVRLKPGVEITDPDYILNPDDVDVHVNVAIKPAIRQAVRAGLLAPGSFEKVSARVRVPQISTVFDVISGTFGTYTNNGPVKIRGTGLDLPADRDTDTRNGVFFLSEGNEVRATVYISESDSEIVCMVPSAVSSVADIIVRTDYEAEELREGRISGITQNTGP